MKKILNQIIINLSILIFLTGCHTLEHRQLFLKNKNKNIVNKEIQPKITTTKKVIQSKITTTKKEAKNKITTTKKVMQSKIIKKKINLESLINFSETELYSKIGKGDFIKKEGQLKNIQYYFSKCFLDIFLIKRNNDYHVNFLQIRSTILNGSINKDDCLDEISIKLKTSFN
jgi:hypothetical protein